MEALFLKLVNMSLTASWLVLAVIVTRVLLKNAPKYIRVILWGFVGLRLIFPFSIESVLSLIPSSEPLPEEFLYAASPQVNTGIPSLNNAINPIVSESLAPAPVASANPTQIWSFIFSQLWLVGLVLMAAYALISYLLIRRRVSASIPIGKNIRLCDHIGSPFILGIISPVVYLPSELDQKTADMVLAHEFAHLKRKDHWWKPLGFALLSVYWFNPVMWLAYVLLCRDIELACDEKVIKDLNAEEKKTYSTALLSCSVPRHLIAACPLAFGEVGVKDRIKSVVNYRKPAFWLILAAVLICIVVAVCFLTDPAGMPLTEIATGAKREILSITVINGDRSYEITTAEGIAYVEEFLEDVKISKREISQSRAEDRDMTNTIILHGENVQRSYHFNKSCSEVWFNDTIKPSMTYSVKKTEDVKKFFESTIEVPAVSVPDPDSLPGPQGLTLSQNGYRVTILESEHYSNGVALTVQVTFPEEIDAAESALMPEDVTLTYAAKNGEHTAFVNHTRMHDPDGSNSILYDFLFNLDDESPVSNAFTLTIPCFEDRSSDRSEPRLKEQLVLSWQADVDTAHSYEYSDGNAKITMNISPIMINITSYKTRYTSMAELREDIKIVDLFGSEVNYEGSGGGSEGGSLIRLEIQPTERIDIDLIRSISIGEYTLQCLTQREEGIAAQYPDSITEVWTSGRSECAAVLYSPVSGAVYRTISSLNNAVYSAIMENNAPEDWGNSAWLESHVVLSELVSCGVDSDGNTIGFTKVAVLAQLCQVRAVDGGYEILSSQLIPAVISFDESNSHSFTVADYLQAGEDEDVTEFIEKHFPNLAANEMLSPENYRFSFDNHIMEQANLYFGLSPRPTVDSLIDALADTNEDATLRLTYASELSGNQFVLRDYPCRANANAGQFIKKLLEYTFVEIDCTEETISSERNKNQLSLYFNAREEYTELEFHEGSDIVELWYRNRITFFRAIPAAGETVPVGTLVRTWFDEAELAASTQWEEGVTPTMEYVLESLQEQNAAQIALNSGGDLVFGEYSAWGVTNDVQYSRALQNYTYSPIDGAAVDTSGLSVCLKFGHYRKLCYLYFYENTNYVRMYYDGSFRYFEAFSKYGDETTVGEILRKWYDQAEYEALCASSLVIDYTGQDYLEAAKAFCEAYEGVKLNVREDSMYRYSFLSCQVEAAENATNQGRVQGILDENGYAFWLTVTFVPGNDRAWQQSMAGNTGEYNGSDPGVPEGAWVYTRCGYIRLTEDGWVGEIVGTGW